MKLVGKTGTIPVQSIVIKESLQYVYSYYEISTNVRFNEEYLKLEHKGKETKLKVLGYQYNKSYIYQCITEAQDKVLSSTNVFFNGNSTVENLFGHFGLTFNSTSKTNQSYWSIPNLPIKALIQEVQNYALIENSYAPFLYLDLEGTIQLIDVGKSISQDKPLPIQVGVMQEYCNTDWLLDFPGSVEFHIYNNDGYHQRLETFKEAMGQTMSILVDTSGEFEEAHIQKYRNQFFQHYFTSDKVVAQSTILPMLLLGAPVTLNNTPNHYILFAQEVSLSLTETASNSIQTFASWPLLLQ